MDTRKIACLLALLAVVAGCTTAQPVAHVPSVAGPTQAGAAGPDVLQNGGNFVTFIKKTNSPAGAQFKGIVTGADNNVWAIDEGNHALAKFTMTGKATEYPLAPVSGSQMLNGIAVGSDNKFYVLSGSGPPGVVETMTTSGTAATISITDAGLSGVTKGPDNNIWVTEYHHIAKITPAGVVTEYSYPNGTQINYPGGDITTGSDGNLWFAFPSVNLSPFYYYGAVMKIVPSTGATTVYSLGDGSTSKCQGAGGIAAGSDANVWVECGAHLARVDPATGNATYFAVTIPGGTVPDDMTAGAGSLIWYVASISGDTLVSFDVNTHAEIDHTAPTNANTPYHVTQGPDKNFWFTGFYLDPNLSQNVPSIGVYLINKLKVTPNTLTLTVGQQGTLTVTEIGVTSWTASSSKPSIASVAAGGSANTFVVTGNSVGTAQVTVKDAMLNSFHVKVTVQ
jgi:streptogramin lyase